MGAPDLLLHLRDDGLELTLTPAGGLHVAPRQALTDDHRAAIRAQRDALVRALQAEAEDPDSSCWPHGVAMNTAEIAIFTTRTRLFMRRGIHAAQADNLADLLVIRDRQHDDRRLCLECTWLGDTGRCLAAATGRMPGADRRIEPVQTVLQRCGAFGLRKGLV